MNLHRRWVFLPLCILMVTLGLLVMSVRASFSEEESALGDVKTLEKQLADANKQIKTLEGEKKTLSGTVNTQADQVKTLEKQLAEANKQLKMLTGEKKKLDAALITQADKVKALEKQLADADKQFKTAEQTAIKAAKAAGEKIKSLEGDLAKELATSKVLAADSKKLTEAAAVQAKLLAEAQKQNKTLAEEKAKLEKGRIADGDQLKKLAAEVAAEQKKNTVLADQQKKLLSEVEDISGKLILSKLAVANEKKASARLVTEKKDLESTLADKNKALESTRSDLGVANMRAVKNAARVSELEKSLAAEKQRADDAESEVAQLLMRNMHRCRIVQLLSGGGRVLRHCP